jgi:hypothetical protein
MREFFGGAEIWRLLAGAMVVALLVVLRTALR